MLTLGIDLGSSSIKVVLFDTVIGKTVDTVQKPDDEMKISVLRTGWAEQDPEMWWSYLIEAIKDLKTKYGAKIPLGFLCGHNFFGEADIDYQGFLATADFEQVRKECDFIALYGGEVELAIRL